VSISRYNSSNFGPPGIAMFSGEEGFLVEKIACVIKYLKGQWWKWDLPIEDKDVIDVPI
jgi:hypothetical protein